MDAFPLELGVCQRTMTAKVLHSTQVGCMQIQAYRTMHEVNMLKSQAYGTWANDMLLESNCRQF